MNGFKEFFTEDRIKKLLAKLLMFIILATVISCLCNAFVPVINNEAAMMQMENAGYSSAGLVITNYVLNMVSGVASVGLFAILFGKDIVTLITIGIKAIEEIN